MTHPIWNIIQIPVPCPTCHKQSPQTINELIHNVRVPCSYCNTEIDISSERWRAFIEEVAQGLTEIRHYPPIGG